MNQPFFLDIGCQVHTPYGRGNVIEISGNRVKVELDEWQLTNGCHPMLYTQINEIHKCSFCDIGTCVYTRYGVGVLIGFDRVTGMHTVRLWRPRGLGSATASLNIADMYYTIKAMPGMKVKTTYGNGVVLAYTPKDTQSDTGLYMVQLSYGVAHLNKAAIIACPEASVLPVAEYLADKALYNLKSTDWGWVAGNTAGYSSVVSSLGEIWEKVKSGETKLDEALAMRARQINEHLAAVDVQDMHRALQERVDAIVSEPGKIQMLLAEGRERILRLMENAEARSELTGSARAAIDDYLQAGKDQVERAMVQVKESSTDNEKQIISSITEVGSDLSGSLSVMRNLAESDPVLKGLVQQMEGLSTTVSAKTESARKAISSSRTAQVLESGGRNLSQRLESLLSSGASGKPMVQDLGKKIMSSIEKQGGSEKGRALVQGVKDRIVKRISDADAERSIAQTVEKKLVSVLSSWKTGFGKDAAAVMSSRLTQLTVLLTMIGEGNMTLEQMVSSSKASIMKTINDPAFKKSASDVARERLADILVKVKETEETVQSRPVSGFEFQRQFTMESKANLQDTLGHAYSGLQKSTGFKGIVESLDSPLLKDVAGPISTMVEKIKSGSFDIDAAIAAAKESLDSDIMETSAQDIVSKGDKVVSVLESLRSHDAVKKALTKFQELDLESSISSRIMNFDPDSVLNEAESALTDTEARNKMINSTKDHVLGFLLEHIPNMSIPDIQGVKDDVQFAVTKLNLQGFKLRKEDVKVTLGSSMSEEFLSCEAKNISAAFNGVRWKYQQLYFPYLSGTGVADAAAQNASIRIGFKIVRVPKGTVVALAESAAESMDPSYNDGSALYSRFPDIRDQVEKIRCDLAPENSKAKGRNIPQSGSSASLSNQAGSMSSPETVPDASLWGTVSKSFADYASNISQDVTSWEPVLIMSSRKIQMDSLSIKIDDSSLSWLYNLLASVFTAVIRDYVCASLKDMLGQQSSVLLSTINNTAVSYWPIIHKILKVDLVYLTEAKAEDVAALLGPPKPTGGPTEITPREYVLKFADPGPLGIQLDIFKTGKQVPTASTSDEDVASKTVVIGSKAIITGAVEGSQAEKLFDASGIRPFMAGATISAVNGKTFKGVDEDGVLELLRGERPLYITVRLSMNGWERLGIHRSMMAKERNASTPPPVGTAVMPPAASSLPANKRKLRVVKITFDAGPLGLKLKETKSCGGAVIITGFSKTEQDEPLQAEKSGMLSAGMVMLSVAGEVVFGRPFDEVMNIVKAAKRPMKMVFVPSPDKQFTFDSPPTDMVLGKIEGFVMVAAFKSEQGPAQQHGDLQPGMVILQVNRVTVSSDAGPEDVEAMIAEPFKSSDSVNAQGKTPKVKLAVRDMDAFMHLIRIRDGLESVDDVVDVRDTYP